LLGGGVVGCELAQIFARLGTVERTSDGFRLHLPEGRQLEAERVLVATGRHPNEEGLGLDAIGVAIGKAGIVVDDRLQAAQNLLAAGDVTGIALRVTLAIRAEVPVEVLRSSIQPFPTFSETLFSAARDLRLVEG
jgi:pyruvate/2-oxoglutarate dehydrogenase complex dihydrolipoamide dehydrogenase (E3) component